MVWFSKEFDLYQIDDEKMDDDKQIDATINLIYKNQQESDCFVQLLQNNLTEIDFCALFNMINLCLIDNDTKKQDEILLYVTKLLITRVVRLNKNNELLLYKLIEQLKNENLNKMNEKIKMEIKLLLKQLIQNEIKKEKK